MSNAEVVARGFKGFPESTQCQCYPECRNDCPDHLQCVRRLPEYAERVFGPDLEAWPPELRAVWQERGWETLASGHARWLAAQAGATLRPVTKCPTCKAPVASNARACPACGHRFHTFLAKLFFWLVGVPLAIAIVYGFIASTPK